MPQTAHFSHQKISDKAIKISALYDYFHTKRLFGCTRISHHEIARILELQPATVAVMLDEFRLEEGQGDTVIISDSPLTRWADATAFYSLAVALDLPDEVMQPVLLALGHFRFDPQSVGGAE